MVAPDDSVEVNALDLLASPALLDEAHINDVSDSDNSFKVTLQTIIELYNSLAVTMTNKTLTTPTIGSFTNATHDHTNAAGGGTITEAAISDLGAYITASSADTLTNKTIDGDNNTILDIKETQMDVGVGASGTVLTSNGVGSPPTYQASAGGNNDLLDGSTHQDTVAGTVVRGDVIVGDSTPEWSRLPVGTNGQVLTSDGTDISWGTASGTGDMVLADAQTVTGAKTFNDTTLLLRNVADTFNGRFTNTNTGDRVYTLPNLNTTLVGVTTTDTLLNKTITTTSNSITVVEADISDLQAYITAASTATLTNKTFDANATGNALSNIDIADHSASGTPDATTFYRGDNTWAAPGGAADNLGNHIATQALTMSTFQITDVVDPTAAQHAATKNYVDTQGFITASSTDTLTNKTMRDFSNGIFSDGQHIEVRNTSGSAMPKGTVIFISGFNVGQSLPEVDLADASAAATMQVIGLIAETSLANNANGETCVSGRMDALDTSSFTVGDDLYASETPGEFTNVKPTGTALVQKIAIVLRSHASLGIIEIIGSGRENDIPNTMLDTVFTVVDDADDTKQVDMSVGAATTSTKTTLTFAQTANRTITYPDATDTLALLGLAQTFTGTKTLNSFKGTGAVTVTNILDEDTLSSDSATALATQQSIKAYVDSQSGGATDTEFAIPLVQEIPEGVVAYPDIHDLATASAHVSGMVLPDVTASTINLKTAHPIPDDLASTPAARIEFVIMTKGAETGDVRLTVTYLPVADTENFDQVYLEADVSDPEKTVTMPTATETSDVYSQALDVNPVAGDTVLVKLARDPADAADDYVEDIQIISATLYIQRST